MRLNPGQQQAVEFVTGPCLVLAGAGSGKTRVITNKIAHLIRECGYQARHIAAVTFTNKAAREMKERVAQTLGRKEARGLMISTFHTLGLDIIKREYAALGMKSNFSLFDDTDQVALLKELTEGLIEDDKLILQQLISTISNWKNDLMTPAQAAAIAKGERDRIFAHCYGLYDAHMKACNVLDFDDLILMPTTASPAVAIGQLDGLGALAASQRSTKESGFTAIWNVLGNPAAAIPSGFSRDGLPLSVQLVGGPNAEPDLIRVSAQLERTRPWADRRPPIS